MIYKVWTEKVVDIHMYLFGPIPINHSEMAFA